MDFRVFTSPEKRHNGHTLNLSQLAPNSIVNRTNCWHALLVKRDLNEYLFQFNQLPFERTQEKFRKRKLLELLSSNKAIRGQLLEVGPGLNPLFPLLKTFKSRTVLEPISEICNKLTNSYNQDTKLKIINSSLEKYVAENSNNKFDTVILSSVLHEIPNPESNLKLIHNLLEVGGKLFVVVPNNESLHRLVGEKMGLINSLTELTETEKLMQQSCSYSPKRLANQLESHGFKIKEVTTSFIKPLPHAIMQEAMDNSLFSEKDLEILYKISFLMPDFGSEIFVVAVK